MSTYRIGRALPALPSPPPPPQPQPQPQEPKKSRKRSLEGRARWRQRDISIGHVNNLADRRECVLHNREAAAAKVEKELEEKGKAVQQQRAALRAREDRDDEVTMQQRHEAVALARQAASVMERGRRCEKWANEFVLGEEGEILPTPGRRMVAAAARMLDTGHIDRSGALHAAVVSEIEAQADPCNLSLLSVGSQVWYLHGSSFIPVTVVAVHPEGQPPFYTIRFDNGHERQTVREKLSPCESLVVPAIIG
jgi:hypothetical protein